MTCPRCGTVVPKPDVLRWFFYGTLVFLFLYGLYVHRLITIYEQADPVKAPISLDQWVIEDKSADAADASFIMTMPALSSVTYGQIHKTPSLVISCHKNMTEVVLKTGIAAEPEPGNYGRAHVEVILDDKSGRKESWYEQPSREALQSPAAIALLRSLQAARSVRILYTPYGAAPVSAIFELKGLSTHLPKVAGLCGWNL